MALRSACSALRFGVVGGLLRAYFLPILGFFLMLQVLGC
jgi:hypothetical protein